MVLPWVEIEALKTTVPGAYYAYPEFLWNTNSTSTSVTASEGPMFNISWEEGILYGGMLLATFYFGYKLYQIQKLRKNGSIQYFPNFTQIIVKNSELAFSFFKSIFLGDKVIQREHESIIKHELVHIEQKHSWDLLFFELMRIVGWFNPLVYVYQKRISELHEFIADAKVAKTHKKEQYEFLLSQVFQTENISFINQFFKSSLIKKRIVMLQKAKSKKFFQMKYLLLIPVIAAMLFYSSCQTEPNIRAENVFIVDDIENLTSKEERELFDKLIELTENSKEWELYVKDENASMKFIPSSDGSHITGPNNEQVHAKLAIDSKLTSRDYNSISDFLKNRNDLNNQQEGNLMSRYNELVMERQRLMKSAYEENPIITNLDLQLSHLKKNILDNNDGTVPFNWTDEPPIFPGCENEQDIRGCFQKSMQKHISDNFKYPQEAQEKGIQGRVNIMFTIDENGNIIDIRKRGPDRLLEAEAERIIELLPKITPGKYDGKVVKTPFSIPISFKLQ